MGDNWEKLIFLGDWENVKKLWSVSHLIDEIENGRELKLEMDAELLNSHDLGLTIQNFIEFKKQSSDEETDEDFEPMEKFMTVEKLTD